MSNRVWIILVLFSFIVGNAWSLRIAFPPTLTNPITDEQLATLNRYLKDLWDIQNGRFEIDVVTTSKSNAKNGEIWVHNNVGVGTYYLQVKAGDAVRQVALSP